MIDSQSAKGAETVSKATRGHDAGKKINARKRHLVVDTRGLPLMIMVTPADLHDAAAAKDAGWSRGRSPGSCTPAGTRGTTNGSSSTLRP